MLTREPRPQAVFGRPDVRQSTGTRPSTDPPRSHPQRVVLRKALDRPERSTRLWERPHGARPATPTRPARTDKPSDRQDVKPPQASDRGDRRIVKRSDLKPHPFPSDTYTKPGTLEGPVKSKKPQVDAAPAKAHDVPSGTPTTSGKGDPAFEAWRKMVDAGASDQAGGSGTSAPPQIPAP